MRRLIGVTLSAVLLMTLPVSASDEKSGELTDPVEILKKLDAAAKAVKSVRYDVTYETTEDASKFAAQGKGTFTLKGWSGDRPELFTATVEAKGPKSDESRKLTAGCDGENYYLVDYAAKIAYEDIDPAVMGKASGLVFSGLVGEFVHPTPFSDEINGKTHELKDSEKIAGEDCYVVVVEYENVQRKATWFISKNDFLPRRRIDHFDIPNVGKGDIIKTITKLEVEPKLDDDTFKLKLPDGFKKTDEFAP
ncbi:MAG: hypothetical protein H6817_02200 [Phycisphaerales bacterium]|nr:hypothetical protein [Phycisphaerales bacterium]